MQGLFVTGTDTGVGKTVVTAAVARLLCRAGRVCRVRKPVATGATLGDGRLVSDDTRCLAEAVGELDRFDEITPWVFAAPVAPPVAARQVGVRLSLEAIAAAVRRRQPEHGRVLVEGVGGLLCPLTENETVADLAVELGLPLVVVARRSLGTLNHTLLTVEAARRRGLVIAGVIVNETTRPAGLAEATNIAELARRIDVPILAVVPYQEATVVDVSPALAGVDWWALTDAARSIPVHADD
jgi:dethiobiotin synthetase